MKISILVIFALIVISCVKHNKDLIVEQIIGNEEVVAYTFKKSDKYGLLDKNYKVILQPRFDFIYGYEKYGTIKIDSGGKHLYGGDYYGYEPKYLGLINTKGEILTNPQYDEIVYGNSKIARVKKKGKYGFIDNDGKVLIEAILDSASLEFNGIASVKKDKVWGIIKMTGEYLLRDTSLVYISGFNENIAYYQKKQLDIFGYVNSKGTIILDGYNGAGTFQYGYGPIYKREAGWGIIDSLGNVVIEPKYGKSLRIDKIENEIWALEYDEIHKEWIKLIKIKSL
ncbi:WG repeat-containing protein [Chondrinema litorale]|uniref:WG repeat-containing protein n=1 Tax=Chondrinema litorale TaxID=2994555 RepID=UPI002543BD33|nr:WG repeat-containing protein [Chondrinema litorale]UZR99787.1 WG repeat-containing protein [Chondrinema litorale]